MKMDREEPLTEYHPPWMMDEKTLRALIDGMPQELKKQLITSYGGDHHAHSCNAILFVQRLLVCFGANMAAVKHDNYAAMSKGEQQDISIKYAYSLVNTVAKHSPEEEYAAFQSWLSYPRAAHIIKGEGD